MEESKQQECGCSQGHDHGHHHDHGHSHERSHSHGGIHIAHHEDALIGSVQGNMPGTDFLKAQEALTEQIHQLGQQIRGQGGIIGHIKIILSSPEHCCQISLTDTTDSTRYFDMDFCRVEGVAIVFGIEDETLEVILRETFDAILEVTEE